MSHRKTRLLLTLDVERDYNSEWGTPPALTFRSVCKAIPELLAPLCADTGMRPTYFVSPETLCDPTSVAMLRDQSACELAAHLHVDYMAGVLKKAQWTDPTTSIRHMQRDLSPAAETQMLAELTELFVQQFGRYPTSFRAGRFGLSEHTGSALAALGYRSDSSVTPGVVWTDPSGNPQPDFRGLPHRPYRPSQTGNLWSPATSNGLAAPLLEVPVTVVPQGELTGDATDRQPIWLRPCSSSREQMLAILDAAAAAEDRGDSWRSLCIMFHSMELVAGASPYTHSLADVEQFLDDLRALAEHADQLGFANRTVSEFEQEFTRSEDVGTKRTEPHQIIRQEQWTQVAPQADHWRIAYRTPTGNRVDVDAVLARHEVQPWHAYSLQSRPERWDNATAWSWLAKNVASDAPILDVGCGVGGNLQWLGEQGFTDLSGCDVDGKAVAVARELATATNTPIRYWVDDGCTLLATPKRGFAAVCAMNWISLIEGFDLAAFLRRVRALLRDDGVLVLDYIDRDFDHNSNHAWLSSDWHKPIEQRAPSEYRVRFSATEIRNELRRHGFVVEEETRIEGPIPRGVLACRRIKKLLPVPAANTKASVLYIVDAPGWAHDHKSNNLIRCLNSRFDGRVIYQDAVTASDLDTADILVIWYWRQLQSMEELGEALTRNRHKLLMGVCSHNELEGEHRAPGLSLLRQLPAQVFTHSELLDREVRPQLQGLTVHCLPNGVDAAFYMPAKTASSARPLRVGWAGSLDNFGADMRGVSTVIQPAIATLQSQYPGEFELVLAAREERLRTPTEMRSFYQSLDVYVCASRVEGTPNPALEAAACGVPVLSTRVGNMPELIEHGIHGLLIERTPNALAAALLLMQQRPDLRAAMGQRIRAAIEDSWQWQQRAEGFANMFESLLQAHETATRKPGQHHAVDAQPLGAV